MLGEPGILDVFRPYFEDVRIKKVRDFDSDGLGLLGEYLD
jgi:hypothetical protein